MSLVQQNNSTISSLATSFTVTLPGGGSPGNTLVISAQIFWSGGTPALCTVATTSGPSGDVWAVSGPAQDITGGVFQFFTCQPLTAGARTVTMTILDSSNFGGQAVIAEFTGLWTLDSVIGQDDSGSATASWVSPSLTPTGSGELLLAQASGENGSETLTLTSAGWTALSYPDSGNPVAYRLGASGAQQATWTESGSPSTDKYSSVIAAFKPIVIASVAPQFGPPSQLPPIGPPPLVAHIFGLPTAFDAGFVSAIALVGAVPEPVSTVAGTLTVTDALAAAVSDTSTVGAGALTVAIALTASATGASSTAGTATVADAVTAAVSGASTAAGTLSMAVALTTSSSSASTTAGTLGQSEVLVGSSTDASTTAGTLSVAVGLTAAVSGASTVSGTAAVADAITSSVSDTSTGAGALSVAVALSGSVTGASTVAGKPSVADAESAAVTGSSSETGALGVAGQLGANLVAASTASGTMLVAIAMTGTISSSSTVGGKLGQSEILAGADSDTSTGTGTLSVADRLTGPSSDASSDSGALTVADVLAAGSSDTSTDSGNLGVPDLISASSTSDSSTGVGTLWLTAGTWPAQPGEPTEDTPDPYGAGANRDPVYATASSGDGVDESIVYPPPWSPTRAPGTVATIAPAPIIPIDPWLKGVALLTDVQLQMLNRESAARQAAGQWNDDWHAS